MAQVTWCRKASSIPFCCQTSGYVLVTARRSRHSFASEWEKPRAEALTPVENSTWLRLATQVHAVCAAHVRRFNRVHARQHVRLYLVGRIFFSPSLLSSVQSTSCMPKWAHAVILAWAVHPFRQGDKPIHSLQVATKSISPRMEVVAGLRGKGSSFVQAS